MIICIFLSSCGIKEYNEYRESLGYDIKGKIKYHTEENAIEYDGIRYYTLDAEAAAHYVEIYDSSDDFVLISWDNNFPFSGTIEFYAPTTEHPTYIISRPGIDKNVYFREDYDFSADTLIVENNTNLKILLPEDCVESNVTIKDENTKYQCFNLISEEQPAVKLEAKYFSFNGIHYIIIKDHIYQLTEDCSQMLITYGIVATE